MALLLANNNSQLLNVVGPKRHANETLHEKFRIEGFMQATSRADFQLDSNRNSKYFYCEVIREQQQTKVTSRMIHTYRQQSLNCAHLTVTNTKLCTMWRVLDSCTSFVDK